MSCCTLIMAWPILAQYKLSSLLFFCARHNRWHSKTKPKGRSDQECLSANSIVSLELGIKLLRRGEFAEQTVAGKDSRSTSCNWKWLFANNTTSLSLWHAEIKTDREQVKC